MSDAQQLSLAIDKPHRNQYLFSDHYLEEILRREKAWTAAQPAAADFLSFLRNLHAAEGAHLADYNEAQLEENWIKPILTRLGHVWEPQASVPGMDKSIKKPDYVFFHDDDTRKAAVADQRTEEYARHALAVGEVKAWAVSLSRKTAGAPTFDNNNPMFQIDYYLKATGAAWGIVGNGRFWRLVHKDSSYRLDRYFEVDLLEALNTTDERRALAVATYFTLFFGRAAFARDEAGRVFLDEVLKGSRTYAVALESDLRDNAYKALEQLILGFFAPAANGLDPNDEGDRAEVYRNSLLLLYRLLFLFYGESRGLLPMGNDGYRERSLTELAKRAAKLVDDHKVDALPPMTGTYWARYKELFAIIDGRDAALNAFLGVPRYNGGLFDPARHAFLETKVVGERHLVRAIDYLARRRKTDNGRFAGYENVDYRTLGVRQLGSIYEGLLEYKVSVAAEEMVTVRKGGKETWLPARERGKTKVLETKQPGELYLATDKGERKATGSYYTPDYIVKYIVEQTLGPLVEEARRRVTSDELRVTNEERARRFEEAILSLNVLDPAMGSGHFLVDATNFLARALATSELITNDELRITNEERSEESDLTYWKRRVVEACIYGVDKNELAVELAKLSLWLETVAADKPLSFLDHHLRHGDSLIGARLSDLERAPGAAGPDRSAAKRSTGKSPQRRPVRSPEAQAEPLFDESAFTTSAGLAVGGAARIEAILTDDLDAVHDKERILRQIQDEHLARWRRLADLWVSAWFGNDMSAEEYRDLALRIQGRPEGLLSDEQAARYLNHPAAADNDYFHWELAFPEVFFDEYGRPKGEKAGFDAVVGNPPYVRQETLGKEFKAFVTMRFPDVFHGIADIYAYFFNLGMMELRNRGLLGFITSGLFRKLDYGAPLRKFLVEQTAIRQIVDFDNEQVFEGVVTYPIVIITDKKFPTESHAVQVFVGGLSANSGLPRKDPLKSRLPINDEQWNFLSAGLARIVQGGDNFRPLKTFLSDEIYRGVTTGLNEAFVINAEIFNQITHSDPKSLLRIRRYLRGEDLGSWIQNKSDFHIIIFESGWTKDNCGDNLSEDIAWRCITSSYKGIANHFKPFESMAKKRYDQGDYWWELRPCSYYHVFEQPRILSTKVSLSPSFSYCDERIISANTSYVLPVPDKTVGYFLLALLNSRVSHFYSRSVFAPKANGYYEVQPGKLGDMPIPIVQNFQVNDILVSTGSAHQTIPFDNEIFLQSLDVHDLLAYLAEQMIAMHKEKQSLTADFWTDLEGVSTPAAFRKLRDKGKQEAGLAADPALAPHLDAASKSTRTLDESLAWDEAAFKGFVRALAGPVDHLSRLVRVYHDHAPRYRELVERIGRTDWLIDRIVYKLYGLTEEEIAIVEGRG